MENGRKAGTNYVLPDKIPLVTHVVLYPLALIF